MQMRVMKRREMREEKREMKLIDIPLQKQNVSRRSSKGICVALIIAFVLTFAAVQTGAALELNWADGIWQNAAGTPTCLIYDNSGPTDDENLVAYGRRLPSCPPYLDLNRQTAFGFDGSDAETITSGVDFDLGDFTHYNTQIYIPDDPFTTVELSVTLSFYIDATHTDVRKTVNYTFDLDETPNSVPCVYPSDRPCADRVLVLNTIPNETFWIGGIEYTLHIVGFVPSGEVTPVDEFITQEQQRNDAVLVAELVVAGAGIEIEKATNGIDADDPLGPYIPMGDPVSWTYNVTNVGAVNLTGVGVIDDQGVTVNCPKNTLLVGENMTCTANGTATAGQYANIGNASGVGDGSSVFDTDPSHYFGCDPDLNITKVANVSSATIGTVIGYNITVNNTGNVNLTSVLVTDVKLGLSETISTLIPNASQSFYRTYTVTELDICAPINNTATANGTDTCGSPVGPVEDSCTVPTVYLARLAIIKTANETGPFNVGSVVEYTINVTNNGTVNVTGITVNDPLLGLNANIGDLVPGQSHFLYPSYIVTQQDACNGSITNTANASGTSLCLTPVYAEDTETVTTVYQARLAIIKTANETGPFNVGSVVEYTINVTNNGTVNVTGITVNDPLLGLNANIGDLVPGQSHFLYPSYIVTQQDACNGSITNTANASGTSPCLTPVYAEDTETVTTVYQARLAIIKTANETGPFNVGSVVEYTINVTNNGTVNVTGITVNDPLLGLNANIGDLVPGQSHFLYPSYIVTQQDACNGSITNTANASGTSLCLTPVYAEDTETVTTVYQARLAIIKTANETGPFNVGSVVEYTINVTNNGTVNVTGITVNDPLLGLNANIGDLVPGQSHFLYPSYIVTQQDACNGSITNTANASGTSPCLTPVYAEDTETVTTVYQARLAIIKTANETGPFNVGSVVEYTINVTNNGTVNVTGITVNDPLLGLNANIGDLVPGQSHFLYPSYIVTQQDACNGSITNTANASGTSLCLTPVYAEDTETVTTVYQARLAIIKTANETGPFNVGSVVEYTINVTNNGTVNVTGITVNDPLLGLNANIGDLVPGQSHFLYPSYIVTQQDACNGSITNTANASGTSLCLTPVYAEDTETVTTVYQARLAIIKTANETGPFNVGSVVEYTINVTNNGTVNVTGITVNDPLLGLNANIGDLVPGQSHFLYPSYIVTQQDACNGSITNTANASGTSLCLTPVYAEDTETVTTVYQARLAIIKTANETGPFNVGSVVEYTINVTNNGTVNVTGITVNDPLLGLNANIGDLVPGQSHFLYPSYIVTQQDACNGSITNTANASGTSLCLTPVYAEDTETVTTVYQARLAIIKTANETGPFNVGSVVEYTINVTNNGTVNVTGITVNDPLLGLNANIGDLVPGQSHFLYPSYIVTQQDACNGSITNTANASGTSPCLTPVYAEDTETVTTVYQARLAIIKTANETGPFNVGSVVEYTINVTNNGTVNVTGITVNDPLLGLNANIGDLVPGQSHFLYPSYIVTQQDACNGSITNTANASGTSLCLTPVYAEDTETVTTVYQARLAIIKTANETGPFNVGSVVEYTINVTNNGTVNVTGITVNDPLLGLNANIGDLVPGQSHFLYPSYIVTQQDACNGSITNTANASGTSLCLTPVYAEDTETVTTVYQARLAIIKTANETGPFNVGSVVEYTINVTNNGTVNVTGITVNDPLLGLNANIGDLVPGQSHFLYPSYIVTQQDACNGSITNTANASGTSLCLTPVYAEDTETVTTVYQARLAIIKTANETGPFNVSDVVKYTINVTNNGTVNVTGITVNDPLLGLNANIGDLVPGQSHFLYPSYIVTQQDACNGSITNTANASGTSLCLTPVYAEDTETVTTVYQARLAIIKTANETGPFNVSDVVEYTINVTNNGTVNVTGITVNDPLLGLNTNIGDLVPGQSHFLYPSYTVTQQDACNGSITNTANASGTNLCLTPVYAEDTETVPTVYNSSISINKTASTHGPVAPGDSIDYWIKVCNTGNLTLTNVTVNDSRFGTKNLDTLTKGACKWFNTTYVVTQQDICNVSIVNYANVTADDYCNKTVSGGPVSWTVNTTHNASISINKTALLTGTCPGSDPLYVKINDTVTYCYNVTNTGYVKLTNVTVVDDIYGSVKLANDTLAPGESTEGTVPHTVVELDKPSVTNIANATGTDPFNGTVNDTDDCTIIVKTQPEVELEKTGSPTIVAPGGNVTYTIKYKNTGAVTLHNVVITEHYPKGVTFISADPAPDAGTNNVWTIGKPLEPGDSGTIVIEVKVPEQIDLSFTETGSVIGEGLVMVTKDLTTEQKPYSLRNRVTLSAELAPVKQIFNRLFTISAYATTKVSGVPGTSLGITESGSGVYSSDEILDLETKNKTIILQKTTHAEYKPTSFNFSDSFSVNFTNKWKQDICSRNMEIDAAIHKKISDATYIDDETISRVDKDKSVMNFDTSFNGSLHIGARTKYTEISETYIGEFDVLQTIQIAKGPIPTPAPTPTPTPIWLPCPYNASPEMNMTEEAEPTP